MSSTVIFRVDASSAMGGGHLSRCVALAIALKKQACECVFVSCEPHCEEQLKAKFQFIGIDAPAGSDADNAALTELIIAHKPLAVVLDGYHFDSDYRRNIAKLTVLTVFDDENNSGDLSTQLVINAYALAEQLQYDKTAPGAQLLLGCDYALLPEQLMLANTLSVESLLSNTTHKKNILVCFGAADVKQRTLPVIQALATLKSDDITVTVICGALCQQQKIIADFCEQQSFEYVESCQNMAPYYQAATAAIAAPGSMLYELAYFKVPTVFMVAASNQQLNASHHAGLGWCQLIKGSVGACKTATEQALAIASNHDARNTMMAIAEQQVDGLGGDRIAKAIIKAGLKTKITAFKVSLIPLAEGHLEMVRAWRNHPDVAGFMLNQEEISESQQQAWFMAVNANVAQQHYLIEYKAQAVGVINIKSANGCSLIDANTIEVGMYLAPECKYRGTVLAFCPALAINQFCFDILRCEHLQAVVMPTNNNAIRFNGQLGYQQVSKDCRLMTMAMNRAQYQQAAEKLSAVIR
ncbi:MAG: UDP-2,4-diacetamido-2,4,6-trideoxy-beta-L-altropyranose hydrolase [Pseudohongiellaceae bacterium]|jgi:UDP-2,4-diacetamido-2,4,6-trideoxy-beta-L-altropyranose hydrolase